MFVREINHLSELEKYREQWADLLAQTRKATFFHTFDWLEVYWKHFGAGQHLRTLLVYEDDEQLAGIVPLVVRREKRRCGNVKLLTFPLDDWGSYYGPIGADPAQLLIEALRHVRRTRCDWHVISLRWLDESEESWRPALKEAGLYAYRSVRAVTSVSMLEQGWDAYFDSRSSKWRNNYRRAVRRLAELGEPQLVRYRPRGAAHQETDPRWDLYEACLQVAGNSWQASSQDGTTISHDSIADYLRDTHEVACRLGAADVNLLMLHGSPVAFAYNYYFDRSVYGLRIGYDPQWAKYAVGMQLYVKIFQDSCERGDVRYDMGPGSVDYKRQLACNQYDVVQYDHFHPVVPTAQLMRLKMVYDHWRNKGDTGEVKGEKAEKSGASK